MENKIKGHGYFRKSKKFGLVSGIVLGMALFAGANSASADEVAATPAPAAAAESSAPKAQNQAQESTVTVDEGLTDAANKAKAAGLTVEQEATKDLGTATTEEQARQFDDTAKKDVAAQKAEIEKKTSDYAAAVTTAEKARKTVVDSVTQNPLLYYAASSQLNDAADVDFNNGKATYGEFSSSKGKVSFINAQNSVDFDNREHYKALLSAGEGAQKEINTYYAQGDMFSGGNSLVDKKNAKVVPISMSQGETITYKVNYSSDSELGKLGVAYVEKKMTLVKSPVKNGKTVFLADRYGSVNVNFVIGGAGNANDVLNIGDWSYNFSKTYYDKNGKIIDSKELTAKVYNKYAFGGKEVLKASDIKLDVSQRNREITDHNVNGALSQEKSVKATFGGESYFNSSTVETISRRADTEIDPYAQTMRFHSQKMQQSDVSHIDIPAKPSVKYHLVSYKKNVDNTLNPKEFGSVEVHYVKDDAAKTVLKEPVTDTANAKVGTKYDTTDNKPKTITKDGKTYELVRTEGKETGEVVEGKTVVTYIYRETVKPTTIHVDGGGKELTPPEDGTKPFAKIPGYEPDPSNPRNNEDPNGQTVRVYKKVTPKPTPTPEPKPTPAPVEKMGSVEVHYVKDDGKTVLKEPVTDTANAKVGTKYDTTDNKPKTITKDGKTYELVRTEGKETGEVVEGKTVVTYIYRETVKPTTIHVDGGGKELTPPEDGTKPFAKIPGYEPDPSNPRNNEDPNGQTVRVYKKVTPKPTPAPVNNTPEKPQPKPAEQGQNVSDTHAQRLPETGESSNFLGSVGTIAFAATIGLFGLKKKDESLDI